MILEAGTESIPADGNGLAVISVILQSAGTVRCRSTLRRVTPSEFDSTKRTPALTIPGMPSCWTERDGRAEFWPIPDQDYELDLRDRAGRDLDNKKRPVALAPVEAWAAAMQKAYTEQARGQQPVTAQRFTLASGGEE